MSFEKLGLVPQLCTRVSELGYAKATPVQKRVIPLVLSGKNVMATAQTGTGKTAAYTLPILQLLAKKESKNKIKKAIRALILVPTRELAAQVGKSIEVYGEGFALNSCMVYGGVKFTPQAKKLERGVDILVATPGRLLEHIKQGNINLSKVEIVVYDESDRILDMGFWEEIVTLSKIIPQKRQTLLFSVEQSKSVERFSELISIKPIIVAINNQGDLAKKVRQTIYICDQDKKSALLSYMIGSRNWKQVLVFTKTRQSADELGKYLEDSGLKTLVLHGEKAHSKRTKALKDFKSGAIRVLVATDIASRGLDIEELPHVINYELPGDAEDYIHRIGRTGRAQNEGEAISLVSEEEKSILKDIERLLKYALQVEFFEGFEPKKWKEKEANKHTIKAKIERSKEKRNKTANNVVGMRKKKLSDRNAQKKATIKKRKSSKMKLNRKIK